ncbi:MAG: decaprenylphospho-beta-D-erythro-pentofuranosid-2-ulose 2-reductase [Acidimicrobiia bacterium]
MKDALGSVQSVLVLGGGSDIARATLLELVARRTRTVILAGRHPEELETVAKEVRDAGATLVETRSFDARAVETHTGFVDEVWDRFGDLDLVLVAFGVLGDQEVAEHDAAAAVSIAATNYVGAVSVTVPVVESLRAQGHGTIVLLSSVAGERARRSNYTYGSSKAGIDAFYQGLADSLVGSGVHVMIVRPGFVRTKMTAGLPDAPMSTTPEAVAEAIVQGLARDAEIVWVPAPLRFVMAAVRHLPRPVFRRLRF